MFYRDQIEICVEFEKMLKKILLLFCLSFGEFVFVASENESRGDGLLFLGKVGIAVSTIVYLANREPNAVQIARSRECFSKWNEPFKKRFANFKTKADLKKFVSKMKFEDATLRRSDIMNEFYSSSVARDNIKESCRQLESRYGSSVKPWNWSEQMKSAHAQIHQLDELCTMATIIEKYRLFIAQGTSAEVVGSFEAGKSLYPWHLVAQKLEKDIAVIETMHRNPMEYYSVLRQTLSDILQEVRCSDGFTRDMQNIATAQLKEREVLAAEAQAEAARQQSKNSMQRNKIEADKLELEREKLRLEKERLRKEEEEKNHLARAQG